MQQVTNSVIESTGSNKVTEQQAPFIPNLKSSISQDLQRLVSETSEAYTKLKKARVDLKDLSCREYLGCMFKVLLDEDLAFGSYYNDIKKKCTSHDDCSLTTALYRKLDHFLTKLQNMETLIEKEVGRKSIVFDIICKTCHALKLCLVFHFTTIVAAAFVSGIYVYMAPPNYPLALSGYLKTKALSSVQHAHETQMAVQDDFFKTMDGKGVLSLPSMNDNSMYTVDPKALRAQRHYDAFGGSMYMLMLDQGTMPDIYLQGQTQDGVKRCYTILADGSPVSRANVVDQIKRTTSERLTKVLSTEQYARHLNYEELARMFILLTSTANHNRAQFHEKAKEALERVQASRRLSNDASTAASAASGEEVGGEKGDSAMTIIQDQDNFKLAEFAASAVEALVTKMTDAFTNGDVTAFVTLAMLYFDALDKLEKDSHQFLVLKEVKERSCRFNDLAEKISQSQIVTEDDWLNLEVNNADVVAYETYEKWRKGMVEGFSTARNYYDAISALKWYVGTAKNPTELLQTTNFKASHSGMASSLASDGTSLTSGD